MPYGNPCSQPWKHIKFRKGFPKESDSGEHAICVIDDLMDQASESMFMQSLFSLGSHHMNLTVIYMVQNHYQKGKKSKSIRLNSDYYLKTVEIIHKLIAFQDNCSLKIQST